MMKSLRVRLILFLGVAIIAAAGIQSFATYQSVTREADKLFDYHMQQMASALEGIDVKQIDRFVNSDLHANHYDLVVQLWTEQGEKVFQSRSYRFLPERAAIGYSTVTLDNGEWRIYAIDADRKWIQIAQKMDARKKRTISIVLSALWPVVPTSLLLFAIVWWVVRFSMEPLNRIGLELAGRKSDALDPVVGHGVPREVATLVTELNSLLSRMGQALQSQQRFIADAAHELRTPMTALKLQAQVLERSPSGQARDDALVRLQGGIDRASHLVEQLLSLANQDPMANLFEPSQVDVCQCVEQAMADVSVMAATKNIRVHFAHTSPIFVLADDDSMRTMLVNLLNNAIRYTPEDGQVQVDVQTKGECVELLIQDSGPGILPEQRERIFDRFYRVPGTAQSGSGLGLAIAKAIADRYGARLQLSESNLGGLAVRIYFSIVEQV